MISWLFVLLLPGYAQTCAQDVARILSKEATQDATAEAMSKAGTVLKRDLSSEQSAALGQILRTTPGEMYLASDIVEQGKKLTKAGFSEAEIAKLRKEGVLGNTRISLANGAPTGIQIKAVAMKEMDSATLSSLKNKEKLNYLVAENGQIFATKEKLYFAKDKLVLARAKNGINNKMNPPIIIREAGELGYDPAKKAVVFKPTHGFETNELATKALVDKVSELSPGMKASVLKNPNSPTSRVIKCLDIVSAQSQGKNFVLDRVIADTMVTTTAIFGSELMGAGRWDTEEGRQIIYADLVGGAVTSAMGAVVGKQLAVRDANFITSIATRTGVGLTSAEILRQTHKQFLEENPTNTQTADDIATFNQVHVLARLPISHYFDKFAVQKLPNLIFNSCQRNPALSVMISPRAVRMYERYSSSVLYYGLRSAIIGQ